MIDLHKFLVAVSGIDVSHDENGGCAHDATMRDQGGILETPSIFLNFHLKLTFSNV